MSDWLVTWCKRRQLIWTGMHNQGERKRQEIPTWHFESLKQIGNKIWSKKEKKIPQANWKQNLQQIETKSDKRKRKRGTTEENSLLTYQLLQKYFEFIFRNWFCSRAGRGRRIIRGCLSPSPGNRSFWLPWSCVYSFCAFSSYYYRITHGCPNEFGFSTVQT